MAPYLRSLTIFGICAAAVSLAPRDARAIAIGVLDDYQNGTVSEWFGGTTITNLPGGPLGPADLFLNVRSNGNGGGNGSKVSSHNSELRWTGDYLAAGVSAIQADMRNLGATTLNMRMVLFGSGSRWTSTMGVSLAPNSGWQHLTFPVSQASLTRVLGNTTYDGTLMNVNQIMFRHDGGNPSSGGEAINGTLGMDNITAVPAPGLASLAGVCGLALLGRRRTR